MWAQVVDGAVVAATRSAPPDETWLPVQEPDRPADSLASTWGRQMAVMDGQPVLSWVARPWTADELAAMEPAKLDGLRAQANAGALQARLLAALAANQTFLARTSPTAAQVAAQAKALTVQANAMIRLALGALDSTA